MPGALKPLSNIHHAVYRCRDAEQTRAFYEDILGLKLATAFEETQDFGEGLGGVRNFMHIFFETGDGNYIAFFDEPERATEAHFAPRDSFDLHLALEVADEAAMLQWLKHLNDNGITCLGPIDHDFVKSIYTYDPNGIPVEITTRCENSEQVMADKAAEARAAVAAWTEKTSALKRQRLDLG